MKTKKCTKCGIEKPLDAEHYHRDSLSPSGFRSWCKVCRLKAFAEHNSRHEVKERKAEYNAKYNSRPGIKERNALNSAENYQNNKDKQPACVYQIVNSVSNKIYIGQTIMGELRWKRHLTNLRGNRHESPNLQADFNKFGEDAFEWSIIKEYPKDKKLLEGKEKQLIKQYEKEGKQLYNIYITENK